ncbi:PREDICTED: uncharacterized protein LOC107350876 [Paramuricea clavata]|uniref:PREDICTED: uncharacterized protein LOC107350876 n=1 Tax=Paramuricea clavata TaxID=317549 RepID=A0A6S7I4U5_PARCT|nr:PREDICTED: uncharacterized protein LOC107350876 [Paramuricea clavata]
MTSKETPKKAYRASNSWIDSTSCRLCRAVGDTSRRKNIFKPSNRALLKIAEQICGHPIVYEVDLPHLICRPCERRLNNTVDFQKVIVETERSFHQSESSQTRFKRCVDVSPSISQPPRSRQVTCAAPSARTSLSFDSCQESRENIENVSPLQDDQSLKQQLNMLLREANKQLVNITRRDEPSVLRDGTYGGLSQETWMVEIVNELSTRCLAIAEILSRLLDCSMLDPGKKLPPICLIYSIIMFTRCHELSRVQRINTVTVLLTEGKASSNVSNRLTGIKYKSDTFLRLNILFERLNKYGFCLSISKKYVVLDDIGKQFLDHAVELVKSGRKFVFVVDNIDWEEKVHDMRKVHQNKSVHAVATSMVFTRVSSDHLPDDGPQKDIRTCNFCELVSMKEEDLKEIQKRYRILVARILIKKFPEFSTLNPTI